MNFNTHGIHCRYTGGDCYLPECADGIHGCAAQDISNALRQPHKSGTEAVARWMISHGYTTGHGDDLDDLLAELVRQVMEPHKPDSSSRGVEDALAESDTASYIAALEEAFFRVECIALACIATHGKRDENGLTGYSAKKFDEVVELGKVNRRREAIFEANGESQNESPKNSISE